MNYNQNECPVCKKEFVQDDDIVVCPVCGTPHHRNCWNENGKCENEALHAEGFVWQNKTKPETPISGNKNNNLKVCPVCGTGNEIFEPVCTSCGTRLPSLQYNPSIPPFFDKMNSNEVNNFNNYYATEAESVFGKEAKIDDISVTEFAEYIQKDNVKYIGKFKEMQEKNTKLSWNWSSFLGGIFWSFYRKMTGIGVLFIATFFSISLISSILVPSVFKSVNPAEYDNFLNTFNEMNEVSTEMIESGNEELIKEYYRLFGELIKTAPLVASFITQISAMLIINIIMGFFGNSFYKSKIKKDILNIRKISPNSMTYHVYLHHRGGTSAINVIMPVLIYIMFTMFTSYI